MNPIYFKRGQFIGIDVDLKHAIKMRKRYDYRNDYKNCTKKELLHKLEKCKALLLECITLNMKSSISDCRKRISYIESKL